MRKNYFLFLFLLSISCASFAQISANVNSNGQQLAQVMSGPGVIISNVNLNCPVGAAGTFTCTNCSLNMDSGIVLTNGYVDTIHGPNNTMNATGDWGTTGGSADTDLANLIGQPVTNLFDPCILEFDLNVQSDSIQFNYIFGSEEYPEFVCSAFNDAFAFFISGPGIVGEKNIALIPGTNVPVSINSVNPGVPGSFAGTGTCNGVNQSLAYSQYYVNNGTGSNAPYNTNPYYIQYNGFTTTLTAAIGGLDVCSTYHLKLTIADVGDHTYDSGVFIQANSLSSNLVAFDTVGTSVPGIDSAVRGCVDGIITLQYQKPVAHATTVNYTVGGTATNGVDYSLLTGSVQFAAGDSVEQIIIHPIGNATQTQTVELYLTSQCGTVYDSATLTIVTPPAFVTGNDTSICPGDTVKLFATPGAATYSWTPTAGLSASNISNPLAYPTATTTYVCVAGTAGCNATDSTTITVYNTPPFSVSAGPDVVSCNNTPVQLNAVVTGTPVSGQPFVYNWVPAAGLSSSTISNPVDNATPNAYIIFVTSGRCSTTDTINVAFDNVTETLSSVAAGCSHAANGSASAAITSGTAPYAYLWSSGAFTDTANGLSAGLYHVTITDQVGCTATDTITVYAPAPVVFGLPVTTPVSCVGGNNGTATVAASGGTGNISYTWSSGGNTATATGLAAGLYTVTATDANLCTATTSVTVSTLPPVVVSINTTAVSCFGGSDGTATAAITGGTSPYSYAWSNASTGNPVTGLAIGAISVTAIDNAGCTAAANAMITQPALLTLTEFASNVQCFGQNNGSIILSANGGTTPYSFLWSDGNTQQDRSNLGPGYYAVLVTDAKGCTDTISATVAQPTALVMTDSAVNATCYGQSNGDIYLTVTGGTVPYTYNWGIGITSQNATNIPADNYYPTVTDNAGCTVGAVVTITSPPQIVFPRASATPVSCFGGTNGIGQVFPSGGVPPYSYTWNGIAGTNPDSGLTAGFYTVTVTDANNCSASDTLSIGQPAALSVAIAGANALCFDGGDGSATDNVTGGTAPYTYLWSDGQTKQTAITLAAGLYQSTVTDNLGCTASSSVIITSPPLINFTIDSTPVKCIGSSTGTLLLHVIGGGVPPYNYAASQDPAIFVTTTDSIIEGLPTGLYLVQVSDANGCVIQDTAFVPNAVPDSFGIITDSTSCFGAQYTDGAIHISGLVAQNSPFQFSVDGSDYQFSGDFFGLAAGTHQISITNYNGCITDTTASIGAPVQGTVAVLPVDTTINLGETIQLFSTFSNYPGSAIVSYNWVPSVGLSCVDCPNPVVSTYSHINNYTLTLTYNNGCLASDSARIIVIGSPPVYIPNTFTPNGDGNNDLFLVYGESIKTVSLKIFNRWGEKVFDSENLFLGWDGNYKGQPQMAGVYVYEAQITFLDNTQTLRTGSITLLR